MQISEKIIFLNDIKSISFSYLSDIISEINLVSIEKIKNICSKINKIFLSDKTIYVAGNGGSAACANHFCADISNELVKHNVIGTKNKIVSLCESIVKITAIANDFGYENVFSKQLENVEQGDLLILFGVSGESINLIKAAELAISKNMNVISIVSRISTLSNISNDYIVFGNKDYGLSEDFQSMFIHLIKRIINGNKANCI